MLHKTLRANTSLLQIYGLLRANNIGESVFLDSCGKGKYSYLALFPYCTFKSKNSKITIAENDKTKIIHGNPFDELKKLINNFKKKYKSSYNKDFPLLNSGCFGYLGYDLVRFLEKIPAKAKDDLKLPDSYFIFPRIILTKDHEKSLLYIFSPNNDKKGFEFITNIIKAIENISPNANLKNPDKSRINKKLDYYILKKYKIKSSLT